MVIEREQTLSRMKAAIDSARNIALFCHIRPDGDALGSMLGLGWTLEAAGKAVQYVVDDELPVQGWLKPEKFGRTVHFVRSPEPYDCAILLDISSIDRAGAFFNAPNAPQPDICIDHHISNPGLARINWVDADAPATAVILADLLPLLGLPLELAAANQLLSGILMDTQGFSTSNTNAGSLRAAARLVEMGADIYQITQDVLKAHSYESAKYWRYGLERMDRSADVIWTTLTRADREASGYAGQDDARLIDYLAVNDSTLAAVLFNEQADGQVKVSWRSKPGINVSAIAVSFGGGGHLQASGAELEGELAAVREKVLAATEAAVLQQKNAAKR